MWLLCVMLCWGVYVWGLLWCLIYVCGFCGRLVIYFGLLRWVALIGLGINGWFFGGLFDFFIVGVVLLVLV